jgi:large subunit ribosomal protein L23
MAQIHDVLVRPLVTEKSNNLTESQNVYAFEVAADSNKYQIREAIERLFGVKVEDVRNWKKAYVKLASGDKLNFYNS